MKVIKLIKTSLKCLEQENELYLAYQFGQMLQRSNYLKERKGRYSGSLLRLLIFFKSLFNDFKIQSPTLPKTDVLVFAGTNNQFNCLISTIKGLNENSIKSLVLVNRGILNKSEYNFQNIKEVTFNTSNLTSTIIIFAICISKLYSKLKKERRLVEINQYLNTFCEAYIYLPYFIIQLNASKPKLVIVSNDHNTSNRCLRLVAQINGVKTLYMQHAHVSLLFPPLNFDYALLDGMNALDVYTKCFYSNRGFYKTKQNVPKCNVFLSGQKKQIEIIKVNSHIKNFTIGIGVNSLDDFSKLKETLEDLSCKNVYIIVRTHPNQSAEFTTSLNTYIHKNQYIKWSNSTVDTLENFLSSINCLIASNTSLHLEAALCGLTTFYLEMSNHIQYPDYYGFVKNGLSHSLKNKNIYDEIISFMKNFNKLNRNKSIKNYSDTYETSWQYNEGELAAVIILKILLNLSFDDIFINNQHDEFHVVYKLRHR